MVEIPKGRFYLGETVTDGERTGEPVMYKSDHLTTHGVIVGMTGSGKTGLGVGVLEEALLSGIPVIVLDPKGDMGNLALTFPDLAPSDFEPWVSPDDAKNSGKTTREQAAATADLWRNGLADWGIGPDRIRELREGAPVTIYTPGSTAGSPLNVIGSLAAPDDMGDLETVRDEIEGFVTSLLTLVDIDADPLSSREHILLSNLIEKAWSDGMDLDLAGLVGQVMDPPLRKLGVFELDQFFPPTDRMKLAMRLNGVIASPSFAAWTEGPDVDIDALTRTADGRPRAAVITLSHLSDQERQFVVTLILSKLITWMRSQAGSGNLRLLLYMDEVFGFLPPTAEPPTKKPMLTLLKQARAFGVGVLLSTQNPVDLDYKALSNTGTWMIGRLQTERDKKRLLDGLTAASGDVDVSALTDTISGLPKRTFVLHRTRGEAPIVFNTRWVMSYLAGPLSRAQIELLAADQDVPATADQPLSDTTNQAGAIESGSAIDESSSAGTTSQSADPASTTSQRRSAGTTGRTGAPEQTGPTDGAAPRLADDETALVPKTAAGIRAAYLDVAAPWAKDIGAGVGGLRLEPALVARVNMLFDEAKADFRHEEEWESVLFPIGSFSDPGDAIAVDYDERDLRDAAPEGVVYALTEAPIHTKTFFSSYKTALKNEVYRNRTSSVLANKDLKLWGRPAETERDFERRCASVADDLADAAAAKLRDKYHTKLDRAEVNLAKADDRARELEETASNRRQDELLSGAGGLLSVFLGGKKSSRSLAGRLAGKLGGASSRRSRSSQAGQRLRTAKNRIDDAVENIRELEAELADELNEITDLWESKAANVERVDIGLEKTDIMVDELVLTWIPVAR